METHSQGMSKQRTEKTEYIRKLNNTLSKHLTLTSFQFLIFAGWLSSAAKAHRGINSINHFTVLIDRNPNPSNSDFHQACIHIYILHLCLTFSLKASWPIMPMAFTMTQLWLQGHTMEYLRILSRWFIALEF